jgi:AraC-like DNA-binding protein
MCERPRNHSVRPAVDLLSSVLRELRFESAAYRWLELGAPFRLGFDQPGLRGVHIVGRGECEVSFPDGTVARLRTGDLVVFPRGDAHVLRSVGAGSGPVLSGASLPADPRVRSGGPGPGTVVVCGAFIVGEPDHPALRTLPRLIHVPAEVSWLQPLVDALRTEAFDGGPGSELVMARLSDALLTRALRQYGSTVDQPGWLSALADPGIAAALQAMHTDLAHPWTVASLARTAGLSRAAFAARFSQRMDQPVVGYLLSLRMQRARTLLRHPQSTVATVAAQVGYGSDVAFAAAFKREVGVPPGAYRRSIVEAQRPT